MKKKLFLLLGISLLSTPLFFCGIKHYSSVRALDEETEIENGGEDEQIDDEKIGEEEPSEEQEEIIDVDEEVKTISSTAKDTIEVIKTFLNQPIVVCGISMTVGSLIVWVFGKVIIGALSKREYKFDEEIKKVLTKLGVDEEYIKEMLEQYANLEEVIKYLIENTKNEKVKTKALEMIKQGKDKVEQVQEVVNESKEEAKDKIEEIKDILGK